MGSSKASSTSNYDYSIKDYSTNQNFENVGKALTGNAVDMSSTTNNYNLASNEAIGSLSEALNIQAEKTAEAVTTQKNVTNEIVNSLQSTAKTNTIMISAVAGTALIGGAYVLSKRGKK